MPIPSLTLGHPAQEVLTAVPLTTWLLAVSPVVLLLALVLWGRFSTIVNAGTTVDYGLLLHTGEEQAGRVARAVAGKLKTGCPELRRTIVGEAGLNGWSAATRELISGVGCPGLLYEPGSIDAAAHDALWWPAGLERVGSALAEGILEWLGT